MYLAYGNQMVTHVGEHVFLHRRWHRDRLTRVVYLSGRGHAPNSRAAAAVDIRGMLFFGER